MKTASHGHLSVKGVIIGSPWHFQLTYPQAVSRVEPISVLAVPNQNNLTFGRRSGQLHHHPAYGGRGSGGETIL